MAIGEVKNDDNTDLEDGLLIEINEENVIVGSEVAEGAVALASSHFQLLQAANYTRDDQIRIYREFLLMVYPAMYMSPYIFSQFMSNLGWQRAQCSKLFRAADVTGRGGISFLELVLWTAALEPITQHSGIPAEIRCRYIFRYFDSNRDQKLEYVEFKELVAAARAARQLPIDALSVARDADVCLRQLGMQPNCQLPLVDFLRGVGELRLRGTSSLLRAPRSIAGYMMDLEQRQREVNAMALRSMTSTTKVTLPQMLPTAHALDSGRNSCGTVSGAASPYSVARHTVRMHAPYIAIELLQLDSMHEESVSPSSVCLISDGSKSMEVLGLASLPVEALTAIHYFATPIDKSHNRGFNVGQTASSKAAWSWATPDEEKALGSSLLKLAEAVRPIFANEPRLIRITSPAYAIGDLHGNLSALLAMEAVLWPSGPSLAVSTLLFLGDYVDRGSHGTELLAYLFAAKLQRPESVVLIRGNHEIRDIQKMFTFFKFALYHDCQKDVSCGSQA